MILFQIGGYILAAAAIALIARETIKTIGSFFLLKN